MSDMASTYCSLIECILFQSSWSFLVLLKVEASNRRALVLLRDDPDGRNPHFRGLYVVHGDGDGDGEHHSEGNAKGSGNGNGNGGVNGGVAVDENGKKVLPSQNKKKASSSSLSAMSGGGGGEGRLSRVFGSGPSELFLSDATRLTTTTTCQQQTSLWHTKLKPPFLDCSWKDDKRTYCIIPMCLCLIIIFLYAAAVFTFSFYSWHDVDRRFSKVRLHFSID